MCVKVMATSVEQQMARETAEAEASGTSSRIGGNCCLSYPGGAGIYDAIMDLLAETSAFDQVPVPGSEG